MLFCNQNGIYWKIKNPIFQYIPFWLQKSTKSLENLSKYFFHFLWSLNCLKMNYGPISKPTTAQNRFPIVSLFCDFWPKILIFAKNAKIHATSRMDKNRSRPRMTLLKASLERFWSIFSNSNFIFDFWAFLHPKRYPYPQTAHFVHADRFTVLVTKRHQNIEISWKKFPNLKVCVLSFQMTCQASPNDF